MRTAPDTPAGFFDRLRARFGDDRVFMDITGIEAGVDFVDAIERAITSCDVLLALIGPEWLSCTDGTGQPRLADPTDFIRIEIAAALTRNVRVVPVLVAGASMPSATSLPNDLKPLGRHQAAELRDTRWDADTSDLVAILHRVLAESAAQRHATSPTSPSRKAEGTAWFAHSTVQDRRPFWRWAIPSLVALALAAAGLFVLSSSLLSPGPETASQVQSPTPAQPPSSTSPSQPPLAPSQGGSPDLSAEATDGRPGPRTAGGLPIGTAAWPMFGYDALHTHWNRGETTLRPPFAGRRWFQANGLVFNSLSAADGRIYVGGQEGGPGRGRQNQIAVVDARTLGKTAWSYVLPGSRGTMNVTPVAPARSDGAVIVGGQGAGPFALDGRTGERLKGGHQLTTCWGVTRS